jgi:hypothetical protein
LEKDRLDLIHIGETQDTTKTTLSRSAARKEDAKQKDLQRLANIDKNNNNVKRGVSMATQINLANIDIREREIEQRKQEARAQDRENMLLSLNLQIHNMYKMLDRFERRAKQYTTEYNTEHNLWKKVLEQELQIEILQEKFKALSREKSIDKENIEDNKKKRKRFDFQSTPASSADTFGSVAKTPPPMMINLSYDDTSGEDASVANGVDV